ncbi:MAG: hypothetical protein M1481_06420 [Candidatus Thermoplasmatota archaeon]|nr:hypothetical protein [Candidatus Thermoplasmatota archaeon]
MDEWVTARTAMKLEDEYYENLKDRLNGSGIYLMLTDKNKHRVKELFSKIINTYTFESIGETDGVKHWQKIQGKVNFNDFRKNFPYSKRMGIELMGSGILAKNKCLINLLFFHDYEFLASITKSPTKIDSSLLQNQAIEMHNMKEYKVKIICGISTAGWVTHNAPSYSDTWIILVDLCNNIITWADPRLENVKGIFIDGLVTDWELLSGTATEDLLEPLPDSVAEKHTQRDVHAPVSIKDINNKPVVEAHTEPVNLEFNGSMTGRSISELIENGSKEEWIEYIKRCIRNKELISFPIIADAVWAKKIVEDMKKTGIKKPYIDQELCRNRALGDKFRVFLESVMGSKDMLELMTTVRESGGRREIVINPLVMGDESTKRGMNELISLLHTGEASYDPERTTEWQYLDTVLGCLATVDRSEKGRKKWRFSTESDNYTVEAGVAVINEGRRVWQYKFSREGQ